jgi:hypothetical protein
MPTARGSQARLSAGDLHRQEKGPHRREGCRTHAFQTLSHLCISIGPSDLKQMLRH